MALAPPTPRQLRSSSSSSGCIPRSGQAFDSSSLSAFEAWSRAGLTPADRNVDGRAAARGAVAAGEQIFNTAPLFITDVRGINDNAALGKPAVIKGTCTTCHDSPK